MNPDILKSYLIKLGISIDNAEFDKLKRALSDITNTVAKNADEMAAGYIKGAGAVVSAIASINAAIVTMIGKVAEADMSYQLFAQKMFMSVEAAKAFKIATDALGYSLNEIAWNPELKERYFELIKQQKEMAIPNEAKTAFKDVRGITQEWNRLKIEAVSATEWISFHLLKLNKGELLSFKDILHNINDSIQKNMPDWTMKAAKFLNIAVQLGEDVAKAFTGIFKAAGYVWDILTKIFDKMPQWAKTMNIFIAILVPLLLGGPIAKGIAAITAVLLLLDDAIGHFEGRPSHPFLAFFWDLSETITHYFTKAVLGAIIAWNHFRSMFDKNIKLDKSFIEDLRSMNAEINKNLEEVRSARSASKAAANQKNAEIEAKEGGVKEYSMPALDMDEFKRRLASKESSGDYKAIGPENSKGRGSALGKYQIMPSNWANWARESGLSPNAPMTPANQELVASDKLNQLFKKYSGNEQLVAASWVGGEGLANQLRRGNLKPLNYSVGGGLKETVNDYIKKVTGSYYKQSANAFGSRPQASKDVKITNGDINVNVNVSGSSASADDIARASAKAVKREMNNRDLIWNREFVGNY